MSTKAQQFYKLPDPVDAIQFTGDNVKDCQEFLGDPNALHNAKESQLFIKTALSETPVHKNWWIVRDNAGYHAVDPETFAKNYRVTEPPAKSKSAS